MNAGLVNVPNLLTFSRVFLTSVFVACLLLGGFGAKLGAIFTFLLASLTDYWDGRMARRMGEVTRFGGLMDPIADKLLTLSAFIAFCFMKIIPVWMVALILARDFLVTGVRFSISPALRQREPRRSGKRKTALQFAAILIILIVLALKETPAWRQEWTPIIHEWIYLGMLVVVAVTLVSGVRYLLLRGGGRS